MTVDPGSDPVPDPAETDTPAGASGEPPRAAMPSATTDPETMTRPLAMLASTADRERAIDLLKAGFAEGRLSLAEHDERVAQVYAARRHGELAPLLADLPAGPLGDVRYCSAADYPPARVPALRVINSLAVASLICGLAELPTLGLSALPAVVLGTRAREQIRETGQRGEGLAVAGLVLGWTAIALFLGAVLVVIIWLLLPPAPGTSGPIGS